MVAVAVAAAAAAVVAGTAAEASGAEPSSAEADGSSSPSARSECAGCCRGGPSCPETSDGSDELAKVEMAFGWKPAVAIVELARFSPLSLPCVATRAGGYPPSTSEANRNRFGPTRQLLPLLLLALETCRMVDAWVGERRRTAGGN